MLGSTPWRIPSRTPCRLWKKGRLRILLRALRGSRTSCFSQYTYIHTYIHTVAISSHSFVAAQLGFAGIGRCCHGVAMALSRNIIVVRCRGKRAGYRAYVGGKYHSYHKTQVLAKAAIKHAISIAKNGLGSTPRPKTKAKATTKQTGAFKESTTIQDHGTAGDFREIISAVLQIISKTAHVISRTSLTRLAF